jgi:opacity protein-like surface antigen
MPRRVPAVAIAVALCLLAVPDRSFSQDGKGDYMGQVSVSLLGGYAVPNTDEYLNAFSYQAAVGYSPVPWLEVALEMGRFTSTVSQPEPNGVPVHTIASGELDVTPVMLTAQLRYPVPEIFSAFYALLGVGYYFVDYSMDAEPRAFLEGWYAKDKTADKPGLDQTVDDGMGFHLGAGVEYHMTDNVSLVGEGRYIILAPADDGRAYDGSGKPYTFSGNLDLNTWLFTCGVKVLF